MKLSDLLMENPGEVKVRRTSWGNVKFWVTFPAIDEAYPDALAMNTSRSASFARADLTADDWEKVE